MAVSSLQDEEMILRFVAGMNQYETVPCYVSPAKVAEALGLVARRNVLHDRLLC